MFLLMLFLLGFVVSAVAIRYAIIAAHKLGVVDQDYIAKSGDNHAVVGRKIGVDAEEVKALATIISKLAPCMSASLDQLGKTP